MAILVAPKFLGFIVALVHGPERRGFGGAFAAFVSVLVEIVLSGLIAPMMMLLQSQAVADVLMGRDAGWQVQRRDDGSLTRSELIRHFGKLTLIGVLLGTAAFAVSLSLFLWMAPVTIGLLLAMPLAALTARADAGRALGRMRLLLVPEERNIPGVLLRANALATELVDDGVKVGELLRRNSGLREAHAEMLPPAEARRRGAIDTDLAIAKAKTNEARTLDEAFSFMSPAETRALLSDPEGYRQLLDKFAI
jgi:membrane glycosyltransferase